MDIKGFHLVDTNISSCRKKIISWATYTQSNVRPQSAGFNIEVVQVKVAGQRIHSEELNNNYIVKCLSS